MSKPTLIEIIKNPNLSTDRVKIQNKINALWNSYTHEKELSTILVQAIYKRADGSLFDLTSWVELPKRPSGKDSKSTLLGIKLFKVRQQATAAKI